MEKRKINQSAKYIEHVYLAICKGMFSSSRFLSIKKQHKANLRAGLWMPQATLTKPTRRTNAEE